MGGWCDKVNCDTQTPFTPLPDSIANLAMGNRIQLYLSQAPGNDGQRAVHFGQCPTMAHLAGANGAPPVPNGQTVIAAKACQRCFTVDMLRGTQHTDAWQRRHHFLCEEPLASQIVPRLSADLR